VNFFVITFFLKVFGTEAIAAFGISIRIEQIAILPALGLSTAALTLVGQNNGARNFERAEKVFRLALKYGFIAVAPVVLAAFIFAPRLVGIFSNDPAVIELGTTILRIGALTDLAYVANDIILATVQALRKPNFVFWNSLFRELILPIGIFWMLIHELNFGFVSIWWTVFAINWIVVIATFLFLRSVFLRKFGK
jgi:Na+-driven multidrug efflux pump